MVALFEDENTQAAPSEAGPAIWSDPVQFAELSERLQSLGADLTATAASPGYTADVFAQIGQICVACHEDCRVKRD